MSLESLNQVLSHVPNQKVWQGQQHFKSLLQHWPNVVGPIVAAQTKPLNLQRGILQVATSSSVWAQNLTLERSRILEKLNLLLTHPIADIRFSPGQWFNQPGQEVSSSDTESLLWQEHPSRVEVDKPVSSLPQPPENTPQQAFDRWAKQVQSRSSHLPTCPQCQCPTPPGELKRWSMCSLCAAKQWRQVTPSANSANS